TLAFNVNRTAEQGDTWVVSLDDPHHSRPLLAEPKTFQTDAVFSPDGKWIAYSFSDGRSFTRQILVRPYPAVNVHQQITSDGGSEPHWSSNGKQLFFLVRGAISSLGTIQNFTLNVVDIRTDLVVSPGTPVSLTVFKGLTMSRARSYDIMPNGQ